MAGTDALSLCIQQSRPQQFAIVAAHLCATLMNDTYIYIYIYGLGHHVNSR